MPRGWVRPSMGSVGDGYDNALCESFFATLECELLDRRRFRSHAKARIGVFTFIEGWDRREVGFPVVDCTIDFNIPYRTVYCLIMDLRGAPPDSGGIRDQCVRRQRPSARLFSMPQPKSLPSAAMRGHRCPPS
ncbi:hypothetical protein CHT98_13940 (plasmid) [Azospirillum brasilense]|uniref:Integrase catalytic domain-containing protein n=1 Tax=Azospirillum brasilense TaxID=192 RepID=A0A235HDQ6_AZOBR|nr:hypothetical protein CHT98_13940 [Azospirillum brasilense]